MCQKQHLQFRERISSDNDPLDVYSLVCLSSESINMQNSHGPSAGFYSSIALTLFGFCGMSLIGGFIDRQVGVLEIAFWTLNNAWVQAGNEGITEIMRC
jgi:hypothetical protein